MASYTILKTNVNKTHEEEMTKLPETCNSRNFLQEYQFLLEITSAVPAFALHGQGQRGSIIAVTIRLL